MEFALPDVSTREFDPSDALELAPLSIAEQPAKIHQLTDACSSSDDLG